MPSKRKKSLIVFIHGDQQDHLCSVHTNEGIANGTTPYRYYENPITRDERAVIRVCKKMLYKAGCPLIRKKTLKVRVTIEPIKGRVR